MILTLLLSCVDAKVSACQDACAVVYETCGFQGAYADVPADAAYAACLDEECPATDAADEWAACILSTPEVADPGTCAERMAACDVTPCENGPWYDNIGWWCDG